MITINRAMVLAAGLGKRMRPLTETLPRPLIEVAGRPLIDRVLDKLDAHGIGEVVVNLHHHRAQIAAHLKTRVAPKIIPSQEAELLETGGGIVKALPLLGPGPFFACNADAFWLDGATPALARLARAWDDGAMDALLLLARTVAAHGYDGRGDYFADGNGAVRSRKGWETAPFIFAGAQIIHPRLFAGAPQERFSIKQSWDRAEEQGRLRAVIHEGPWFHVGTPEAVHETERVLEEYGAWRRRAG